ncbi:MAG: PulJ/GspJ family protein [Candidatus Rifleibacteriota bacterium]
MRSQLHTDKGKKGFTIVELVVAILVFSGFVTVLMYLYSRSNDSFKITLWKQQRTAESEIFWSFMRKHLEEATNELDLADPFVDNPDVVVTIRPLKFHPTPNSVSDGNIMAWNCSKIDFKFSPSPSHSVDQKNYFLKKNSRVLDLRSSAKSIAKIQDVTEVDIKATSVMKTADFDETFITGPNPDAVGTVVEISITMQPPKGFMAQDLKIVQSHKFRANVGSVNDSNPSY